MKPLSEKTGGTFPHCDGGQKCDCGNKLDIVESCYWDALHTVRKSLDRRRDLIDILGTRLTEARKRLDKLGRKPRKNAPHLEKLFTTAAEYRETIPEELQLEPGTKTTLRGELGRVLNYYNKQSGGAVMAAAADLLGSTSVLTVGKGFPEGYYHAANNPESRILSVGGICEDAMSGVLSGMSTYGHHVGVGSSYGAFIAALGHISARLHAIGNQARQSIKKEPYKPFVLICAHAGVKTGEDGPTPQPVEHLAALRANFPRGTMLTLTPWDPAEMWPLMSAAFESHPAVIAPFVTRPTETILDREAQGGWIGGVG